MERDVSTMAVSPTAGGAVFPALRAVRTWDHLHARDRGGEEEGSQRPAQ